MKEKIKKFFTLKKNASLQEKEKTLNTEKEFKALEKENEILKAELRKSALEKFKTRRSIRKFSDKPVDWKTIYEIIEGSLNAPCAGNIQNYHILVIDEKKKRHELGKIAFQQFWLSDAQTILVVIRDNYHLCQLYPQEGEIYAIQNSAALIENILMLSHFYDLGACWVEAYDNEVLKEYLEIPPNLIVDAIIPIGYPLEKPHISKDPTMQKIFFNSYANKQR